MKFLNEFKTFALKGNVMDMAVGIIIGGAFGKIVSSIVNDVIMPPIGVLVGGVDFKELKLTIKEAVADAPAVTMNYGNFLQVTFDFMIIAFSIFMVIRFMNNLSKRKAAEEKTVPPPTAPAPTKEELLLTEIRDLLKSKQ